MISGERFNHSGKMRTCQNCLEYIDKFTSSSSQSSEENVSLDEPSVSSSLVVNPSTEQEHEVHFDEIVRPPPLISIPPSRSAERVEMPQLTAARLRARAPTLDGTSNQQQRSSWYGGPPRSATGSASHFSDQDFLFDSDDSLSRDSDDNDSSQEDEKTMRLYSVLNPSKSEADLPRVASVLRRSSGGSLSRRPSFRRPQSGLGHYPGNSKGIMRIGQRKHSFYQQEENRKPRSKSKSRSDIRANTPTRTAGDQSTDAIDLNRASIVHANKFLDQLLNEVSLSAEAWHDALMQPLMVCVETIDLDVRKGDSIDIRHYVKLKKIPGGSTSLTKYLNGAVFTKNVALKGMPQNIDRPRILLLNFPIEYNRNERFMSLDPILSQEDEFLRKLVARICALGPNIIVSGSSINGIAAKLLANENIVVITHVKVSTLARLSRYTGVDIVTSIDRLATEPRLGSCDKFEVKTFRYGDVIKTFLFFSGSQKKLGCTILLRGADQATLGKVKDVVEFMVYVLFNLRLETALMRDLFVTLPLSTSDKELDIDDGQAQSDYFQDLSVPELTKILSSSPLVDFGCPYLLKQARQSASMLTDVLSASRDFSKEDSQTVAGLLFKLDFGGVVCVEPKIRKVARDEKETTETDLVVVDIAPAGDNSIKRGMESWLPGSFDTGAKILTLLETEKRDIIHRQWCEQKRQWELANAVSPYMFSPSSHQSIVVLFSLICTETRTPCIGPDQLAVDFYTDSDMTLGQYVESLCLLGEDMCEDGCGYALKDHHRTYVHGSGRLTVNVEELQSKLPGLEDQILTWSYCKECDNIMQVLPLSASSWKYSFGKYLELYYWSEKISPRAGMCPHNVYRDHIRYFGYNDMVVKLEWSSIDLLSVLTPKPKIYWRAEHLIGYKFKAYFSIENKIHNLWGSVLNRLKRVVIEGVALDKIDECRSKIAELTNRAEKEKSEALASLVKTFCDSSITDILCLNQNVRIMHEQAVDWDQEFLEFEKSFLPSEKDIAHITAQQLRKIFLNDDPDQIPSLEDRQEVALLNEKMLDSSKNEKNDSPESKDILSDMDSDISDEALDEEKPAKLSDKVSSTAYSSTESGNSDGSSEESQSASLITAPVNKVMDKVREIEHAVAMPRLHSNVDVLRRPTFPARGSSIPTLKSLPANNHSTDTLTKFKDNPSLSRFGTRDLEQKLLQGKLGKLGKNSTRVSSLAKHFDQLSMEFEKERARERKLLSEGRFRASPVVQSRPVVEVYKNVEEAVLDTSGATATTIHVAASDNKPSEVKTTSLARNEPLTIPSTSQMSTAKAMVPIKPPPLVSRQTSDAVPGRQIPDNTRTSLGVPEVPGLGKSPSESAVPTIPQLGDEDSADKGESPQDRETGDFKHPAVDGQSLLQTLTSFWADRSATGWSPLAYPLLPSEHMFTDSDVILREDEPSSLIAFCISSSDYNERMKGMLSDTVEPQTKSNPLETWMLKKTAIHLKYDFEQGSAKLSCKIFFSEQFEAFRKQCGCDGYYIQSLARCVKWDSRGGKSGSAFLKTLDDRLIVKQLSPSELDAFVLFAPSYFEYMAEAFFHDLPTVLAKIFGFYQIRIKNPITGNVIRLDLIVMENLFYKRKMTRIFDLKGSMRNRHVQQTGREDEVLLDENMVEYIYESPLFVREHSKKFLRTSLYNDTLFLAKMNVMDYSLVIGIDEEENQLVVGIIDFIRTFTWDKKLESWVKERGLVRGGVKEPTVVSPRQYKNRFREAMERYILMVPDCWYQEA